MDRSWCEEGYWLGWVVFLRMELITEATGSGELVLGMSAQRS